MIVVLDTSALGKLLVEEPQSPALRQALSDLARAGHTACISSLAETELRRMAIRLDISVDEVHAVLEPFTLVRISESVLQLAGRLPHRYLRTLDAIHIATALTVEARTLVTYDGRQSEAAPLEGLDVHSPQ